MMAHIIADPIAAIVHGGKRITAVSNVLSRMAQCIAITPAVTVPICINSRVERIASRPPLIRGTCSVRLLILPWNEGLSSETRTSTRSRDLDHADRRSRVVAVFL